VCAILPAKAASEITYTVSGGTYNPSHSLIHCLRSQEFLMGQQDECWSILSMARWLFS